MDRTTIVRGMLTTFTDDFLKVIMARRPQITRAGGDGEGGRGGGNSPGKSVAKIFGQTAAFFNTCIVPLGFLLSETRVNFPGESHLRQNRATRPTVHAGCFSVSIIHRTLTWTTGSLKCAQMLTHAIAHCGCTDTVRESALKVDPKTSPFPHRGIEPASAVCRSDAVPTELHLPHPQNVILWLSTTLSLKGSPK